MAMPWSREQVEAELKREAGVRLVVEEEQAIIGYLFMMIVLPDSELLRIGVDPSRQKKGVGSLLLEEGLSAVSKLGAEQCFLEVRRSNTAARRAYDNAGFVEVGIRPRYYEEPLEDAVIMQRELTFVQRREK